MSLSLSWIIFVALIIIGCSIFLLLLAICLRMICEKINISPTLRSLKTPLLVRAIAIGSVLSFILVISVQTVSVKREVSLTLKNLRNCTSLKVQYHPGLKELAQKIANRIVLSNEEVEKLIARKEIKVNDTELINKLVSAIEKTRYERILPFGAYATKINTDIYGYKDDTQIVDFYILGSKILIIDKTHRYRCYRPGNDLADAIAEILSNDVQQTKPRLKTPSNDKN